VTDPSPQIKQAVLQRLVGEESLYQESQKFPVDDAEKKVAEVYQQNQARAPSAEAFEQALVAEGLTEQSLKAMIGRRLSLWSYVQSQIRPGATVKDQEVAQYYEQNPDRFTVKEEMVRASHILMQAPSDAKQEDKDSARETAGDLQKRAAAGEDFADLAKKNSQGPSAANGGDLGFFTRQRMVKPFADAAFALEVGGVSEVVETQYGYHVIKLTDRREPGLQSFDQVRTEIATQLTEMAVNKAVQTKIEELKSSGDIQLLTPHL
jgi:peptidyl-prolyl cis-trans isomerase C